MEVSELVEHLENRIAFVDIFDQCWGQRWRPGQWVGVIDGLYRRLGSEDVARMAHEALSEFGDSDRDAWHAFVHASGATPAEWSPADGPHDQWGNPIEVNRPRPSQLLAETYIEMLTGRTAERSGLVKCPFHKGGEERTASLALNGPYWRCFGCATGGTVIDFAGLLWGLDTKGSDFLEIRRRLRAEGIDS